MKFFTDCRTKEELKKTFNKLAKCFHPDKGGNSELMIELQKQYDEWGGNVHSRLDDFQQQAWNRSFKLNRIRTNDPIPFDHPIHYEIRDLKVQISSKDKVINDFRKTITHLHDQLIEKEETAINLASSLSLEKEKNLNLEHQTQVLKTKRPLALVIWYDYLKPYLTRKHAQ